MFSKFKFSTIFWIFVWSIFMGITVGSIGLGALFPGVNRITAPFVCKGGRLDLVTQDYHPSPVETVTTLTWYCVDASSGVQQEVSPFTMALISGPFYGLVLFFIILLGMWVLAKRRDPSQSPLGLSELMQPQRKYSPPTDDLLLNTPDSHESLRERMGMNEIFASRDHSDSLEQRLDELKRLRDSGRITEQEYAKKKAEILADL
jgi:putative oligomerization/nucleic acid binding protein